MHRLTILDDKGCANVIYGELRSLAERIRFCHYYPGAAHPISRRNTVSVEIDGPVSDEIPSHQLPFEWQAQSDGALEAARDRDVPYAWRSVLGLSKEESIAELENRLRIMDAAPDLLAACERSLERCAVSDEWTDVWAARGHQWAMDRKAMREAVKKARTGG